MDLVVKISTDFTANGTLAQFINPENVTFSKELVNSGDMTFTVGLFDPQIAQILEFRKVELCAIENGEDFTLWTGVIEEIQNDFNFVNVKCAQEKDWLKRKMLFEEKDWSAVTIASALNIMITEANARKGVSEAILSYSTSLDEVVGKVYPSGTYYFDIMKDLAELFGAEWDVVKNEIIIEEMIGTDRTTIGDDFLAFVWNVDSPNENNITKMTNFRRGAQIATRVIGKDKGGDEDALVGDTSIFGSVEQFISFSEGSTNDQLQAYLDSHEVTQEERNFEVNITEEQFKVVSVGDLIHLNINLGSPLVDFSGSLKVIKKSCSFENKSPNVSIVVATSSKAIITMSSFLADLSARTRSLELS